MASLRLGSQGPPSPSIVIRRTILSGFFDDVFEWVVVATMVTHLARDQAVWMVALGGDRDGLHHLSWAVPDVTGPTSTLVRGPITEPQVRFQLGATAWLCF